MKKKEIDMREQDEYGLYIHASNYRIHGAEMIKILKKKEKWDSLPWYKKLLANLYFPIWLKYH